MLNALTSLLNLGFKMILRYLILGFTFILPLAISASDHQTKLVYTTGSHDVNTTMNTLEKLVTSKGLVVIARINHQAAADKANLTLTPVQVLVFGNPALGTPLMQENPASGLDLPLRIAVYQDKQGKTQMVYHNPLELAASYGISNQKILAKMTVALKKLTAKAAQ